MKNKPALKISVGKYVRGECGFEMRQVPYSDPLGDLQIDLDSLKIDGVNELHQEFGKIGEAIAKRIGMTEGTIEFSSVNIKIYGRKQR